MLRDTDQGDGRLDVAHERRLIQAAQRGCRASARSLIDAHQERLHAFVWRLIKDPHDAEEICQEAFLKAFAALSGFDLNFRFSTWLFTIAYRVALNHIRRKKQYGGEIDWGNVPSSGGAGRQAEVGEAVANSDAARRMKDAIWDAVDRLPEHQRAAVMLFYREQLSCQQIGEVLDMPAATVKSHLHRARERLRSSLAGSLAQDWAELRFGSDAG